MTQRLLHSWKQIFKQRREFHIERRLSKQADEVATSAEGKSTIRRFKRIVPEQSIRMKKGP